MNKIKIVQSILLVTFLWGCSQSTSTIEEPEGLNDQQLELKSKLEQTSHILTELVRNPLIVKEIQLATNYSLVNGRDEDVTFSELFYEDAEYKIALKSKNENMIGAFKDSFREYIYLKSKTNGNEVDPELEAYLVSNHLKIYFPYSENWTDSESINPTISYHPLINEDINEGFINSTGHQKSMNSIETVMVDDQYAYDNPSFLVVPCEDPPNLKVVQHSASFCGGGGGGGLPPGDGGNPPEEDGEIAYKTSIGYAKLTQQKDGLFAGGSEIYWLSSSAVFTSINDTIPTLTPISKKYSFSRPDIKNKRWKKLEIQFDLDWSEYEVAREMWIIEGDGDPKLKKLGITLKKEDLGEIGFNFEQDFQVDNRADSRRETLFLEWVERDVYMVNNTLNNGHGWKDDFAIYHADHLYWTTPIRELNY